MADDTPSLQDEIIKIRDANLTNATPALMVIPTRIHRHPHQEPLPMIKPRHFITLPMVGVGVTALDATQIVSVMDGEAAGTCRVNIRGDGYNGLLVAYTAEEMLDRLARFLKELTNHA